MPLHVRAVSNRASLPRRSPSIRPLPSVAMGKRGLGVLPQILEVVLMPYPRFWEHYSSFLININILHQMKKLSEFRREVERVLFVRIGHMQRSLGITSY